MCDTKLYDVASAAPPDMLPQLVALEERAIYRGGCDGTVRFNPDGKVFGFTPANGCVDLPVLLQVNGSLKCFEVRPLTMLLASYSGR